MISDAEARFRTTKYEIMRQSIKNNWRGENGLPSVNRRWKQDPRILRDGKEKIVVKL